MFFNLRQFSERNQLLLGFGLFVALTHAYFYNGSGWNQNARLDSIYSVVEPKSADTPTFSINQFITHPRRGINTGDWAVYDGNYYSNKPPGTMLLGIPVYFVLYHTERLLGLDPTAFDAAQWNAFLINLFVSVFFTALSAALFLSWLLTRYPGAPIQAFGLSMIYAFGTLMFPFSSQLWGHATAAALCLIAWVLMSHKSSKSDLLAGIAMGLAVLCDFLAGLPVVIMTLFLALKTEHRRRLVPVILGGLPSLLFLLVYNKICFGSAIAIAPSFSSTVFIDPELAGGLFGKISPINAYRLLLSPSRGIFLYMPILFFSIGGAICLFRKGAKDIAVLCAMICIGLLFVVSAFNGWRGGNTSGARYLIVAMPFWCILLSGLIGQLKGLWRHLYCFFAALSGLNMLVIVAVTTMITASNQQPLYKLYEWFLSGKFAHFNRPVRLFKDLSPDQWQLTKFNLGQVVGLEGLFSLIPWLVLFVGGVFVFTKTLRKQWDNAPG